MFENFRFETFVDVHSNIFEEYLSLSLRNCRKKIQNTEPSAIRLKAFMNNIRESWLFWIQKTQAIYPSRSARL